MNIKSNVVLFLDGLSVVCEHRVFGLAVWVAIAVLNEMEAQWAIRTVAGLLVVKTYLSGNWNNRPPEGTKTVPPTATDPV